MRKTLLIIALCALSFAGCEKDIECITWVTDDWIQVKPGGTLNVRPREYDVDFDVCDGTNYSENQQVVYYENEYAVWYRLFKYRK